MASVVAGRRRAAEPSPVTGSRAPAEGWITVVLHAALLVTMANAIVRAERADRLAVLTPLAVGGLFLGLGLAKTRIVDLLAHLTAFLLGTVALIAITAVRFHDIGGGWRTSLHHLADRNQRLYDAFNTGQPLPDDLLVAVIGLTLWLVGYSSAWMLFRRRWLGPALLLPGLVILTSLGFARDASSAPVYVYFTAGLVLAARHCAFRRQQAWRRVGIPTPAGLGSRFLAGGLAVACIAGLLGWTLPVRAPDSVLNAVADRADQTWQQIARQWNRFGTPGNIGNRPGAYPSFADSFRIGGPINLTKDPVALLTAPRPNYLALRRYDNYDGHAWSTNVDQTFRFPNEGNAVHATRVTFVPSQDVQLSSDVTRARTADAGVVTIFRQKGGLLATIDAFTSSTEPIAAQLGWKQLTDAQFDIGAIDLSDVPRDLQELVASLKKATFSPGAAGSEPAVSDPQLAVAIQGMRNQLKQRYPLETRIESRAGGHIVLFVSGRLPVYDDIEAVYGAAPDRVGSRYAVTGLLSVATPDELRAAGSNYPAFVAERYLQLPATVTDETKTLTRQIAAAGPANPFDEALAIQQALRAGYSYVIDGDVPPADRDFVDYFLFEKKSGRCEHFATSMAVMLRTLGIPSRLVAGYYKAPFNEQAQGYLYREDQAHTWVEAFFPGYGWIPFEPTPSQNQFTYGPAAAAPQQSPHPTPEALPTATPTPAPTARATPAPMPATTKPDSPTRSLLDRVIDRLGWIPTAIAIATAAAVIALVLTWLWGLRGLSPAASWYARALRLGKLWGIRPDPTMTPSEFAAEFGRAVPAARGPVRVVADLYAAEQYGNEQSASTEVTTGRAAWKQLRAGLLRWRPWARRRTVNDGGPRGRR